MIKLTKSNVVTGEDEITFKKVDGFVILFSTPSKGFLNANLQGIASTPDGYLQIVENVLPLQFEFSAFDGKDLLVELHNIYIQKLQELNPEIEFTITELTTI
jgi:hypothetical protein